MDDSQSVTAAEQSGDTIPLEDKVAALTLQQHHNQQETTGSNNDRSTNAKAEDISYRTYQDENDLDVIVDLVAPYLSEPYSVYCYRYFLHGW